MKCIKVTKVHFQCYLKDKQCFLYYYCASYICLKCNKHIRDPDDSVFCDKWVSVISGYIKNVPKYVT